MKRLFSAVMLLAAITLLPACNLQSPEQRAELAVKKISYDLDLNDNQKAKLNEVKQAYLDSRKANEGARDKHFNDIKQLLLSEKIESSKVKPLMTDRQKMWDKAFDSILPKFTEFHSSLTADQKRKAVEMLEKFSKVF
jgi:hypothetical protein